VLILNSMPMNSGNSIIIGLIAVIVVGCLSQFIVLLFMFLISKFKY